jgi:hypothetical protein
MVSLEGKSTEHVKYYDKSQFKAEYLCLAVECRWSDDSVTREQPILLAQQQYSGSAVSASVLRVDWVHIMLKLATMRALLFVCMLGLAGLAAADRQLRQVHEQELLGAKVGV